MSNFGIVPVVRLIVASFTEEARVIPQFSPYKLRSRECDIGTYRQKKLSCIFILTLFFYFS